MSDVLLEMQTAQWPHSYYSYTFNFFYVLSSCCQIKSPFFCRMSDVDAKL